MQFPHQGMWTVAFQTGQLLKRPFSSVCSRSVRMTRW
ncbi:hypothetical protein [Paludibacterium denitrificans]|nr:hypothetical protein [Paludibacterium denitrificans]